MFVKYRIELLAEKKLIGRYISMSLSNDKTVELWKSFMPSRKLITNSISADLFEILIYDEQLGFRHFNRETQFVKWVALEVQDFSLIPAGMYSYILKGGLYAVFLHVGTIDSFPITFNYIFSDWLPNSAYEIDQREHFQLLGNKYKNNASDSEEEIWIPVKKKSDEI